MIALGPRDIARAVAFALAVLAVLHIADRIVAGITTCTLEHRLPR